MEGYRLAVLAMMVIFATATTTKTLTPTSNAYAPEKTLDLTPIADAEASPTSNASAPEKTIDPTPSADAEAFPFWDSVNSIVTNFCQPEEFKDGFTSVALVGYAPCFEDIVVMGPVHVTVIVFLLWRILHLRGVWSRGRSVPMDYGIHTLRLVCAVVLFAVPLLVINVKLFSGTAAPFEIVSYTVTCLAYLVMVVSLQMETHVYLPKGFWIYRFCWILTWVAASVKIREVIILAALDNRNYYTTIYSILYAANSILSLLALFHWPPVIKSQDALDGENNRPEGVELDLRQQIRQKDAEYDNVCPERDASWVSKLLYLWMSPVMTKGYKRSLEEDDVWKMHPKDSCHTTHKIFKEHWEKEQLKPNPKLWRALYAAFGSDFRTGGYLKGFYDISLFAGPMLLGELTKVVGGENSANYGYAIAMAIFASSIVGALFENQYFRYVCRCGIHVSGALTCEIFDKAMRLSNSARANTSTGQITNIMSVDAEKLEKCTQTIHQLWACPAKILFALVLLMIQLGMGGLMGAIILAVFVPIQAKVAKKLALYLREKFKFSDTRISLTREVFSGIRLLKFYNWESSYVKKVTDVREDELVVAKKAALLRGFNVFVVNLAPILMALGSFGTFALMGSDLTPAIVFSSVALFNVLRTPMFFLPMAIQQVTEAQVSLQRIEKYLLESEVSEEEHSRPCPPDGKGIFVEKGHFTWYTEGKHTGLTDISLDIPEGQLVCVVGATGSGKSSLLQALLGEMQKLAGNVAVAGRIGYVEQQAWIFRGSLKENILFGTPMNYLQYNETIDACQLRKDFDNLAHGDEQEIGESGINLSGGQKQRLSVARAVYADCDTYLFDDSLSALDAHVSKAMFEQLIMGKLKGKTRVFACNQLHFLPQADWIVVMDEGAIVEQGTYKDLSENGEVFSELVKDLIGIEEDGEEDGEGDAVQDSNGEEKGKGKGGRGQGRGQGKGQGGRGKGPSPSVDRKGKGGGKGGAKGDSGGKGGGKGKGKSGGDDGKLITKENRDTGSAFSKTTMMAFCKAVGGVFTIVVMVITYSLIEFSRLGTSYWMTWWSEQRWDLSTNYWLLGMALWSILSVALNLHIAIYSALRSVMAARSLHEKMFVRLVKAPVAFFDSTPLGRIINRFTKDIMLCDGMLMGMFRNFMGSCFTLFSTILVIGINTPYTFIIMVVVFMIFYWMQNYYRSSSRELKRLDSIARSPVYSIFGECLSGMATIRASHAQDRMIQLNSEGVRHYQRFVYALNSSNRWLSVRLELLGATIILAAGVFSVMQREELGAATLGMTLSYTFTVTSLLNMLTRVFAELENCFTCVERISEYHHVEQESTEHSFEPPADWPTKGEITFSDVEMKYRPDLPPTLKGVSFGMNPSEKVGVVGRTGAGKSTLFLTLFRFVECCEGEILIDGVDISKIPISTLRRSLSIIPQEPVLFSGTVRYNLDPFNEHTDESLWEALHHAHLSDLVHGLTGNLDSHVTDGGANFSVGQRQLLCLARALLRRNKILVVDEATANIDSATDALIQKTIREQFRNCTTMTIAHRLNTIIDTDRVVVLDHGNLMQFDTPKNLISIPPRDQSIFRDLVNETGPTSAAYLRAVAFKEINLDWEEMSKEAEEELSKQVSMGTKMTTHQAAVLDAGRLVIDALGNPARWKAEAEEGGMTHREWVEMLRDLSSQIKEVADMCDQEEVSVEVEMGGTGPILKTHVPLDMQE